MSYEIRDMRYEISRNNNISYPVIRISYLTVWRNIKMENENLYTFENPEYRKTFWHTSSHVMAQAVKRLWPEVQCAIGPAIDEGWYYDFDAPFAFTPDHLKQIVR